MTVWGDNINEVATSAVDPDKAGVGSSVLAGSFANNYIFISPNLDKVRGQVLWKSYYLCSFELSDNEEALILGLRQVLTQRNVATQGTGDNTEILVTEREILSPFFMYPDASVNWSLRLISPNQYNKDYSTPRVMGQTNTLYETTDSVNIAIPAATTSNLILPGEGIASYGSFSDIRFPWQIGQNSLLRLYVRGPGRVIFCAQVKQTDPATRQAPPDGSKPGLRLEDYFWSTFQNSVLGHIGGAILYTKRNCVLPPIEFTCG